MKWLYGVLLVILATFCTDYLVPLDAKAQGTFGGLLGWAWPWATTDSGPLGTGFQITGFYIAVVAGALLLLAALAVVGIWVPAGWWRSLAVGGALLSIVLMSLYISPTKLLPLAGDLVVLGVAFRRRLPIPAH
jgi:hypothetical protein